MRRLVAGVFLSIILLVTTAFLPVEDERGEGAEKTMLELYSTAAVLMDADTGRVLYGKNADRSLAMASTTKIMTCILALETSDMEEEIPVSAYAAGQPKVHLGMRSGETYRLKDLLYSLMLESHNDSAVAIAEHIGKKYLISSGESPEGKSSKELVTVFARLMNEKAERLGCGNTWFITPNGLDAEEIVLSSDEEREVRQHSTTARDLARIFVYCIRESPKAEEFLQITRRQNHSFSANRRSFSLTNHNAFLQMMEGALSGKTGFTGKAGYCYVGALEREGKTFVVALLGCGWPNHKTWKWRDTRKLMSYGLDHYEYRKTDSFFPMDNTLMPIPVEGGKMAQPGEEVSVGVELLQPITEWKREILLSGEEELHASYIVSSRLTAPVKKGTKVGVFRLSVDAEVLSEIPIVTTRDVERLDYGWCFWLVLKQFLFSGQEG